MLKPVFSAGGLVLALAVVVIGGVAGPKAASGLPPSQKPVLQLRPAIAGTSATGKTLSAFHGMWRPRAETIERQWKRCNADGLLCDLIEGATARTYVVKAIDAGKTLRVTIGARNANGVTFATSPPTPKVSAPGEAPPPPVMPPPLLHPRPHFVGDFETGDLTQWPYHGDAHGVSVVSSPTFDEDSSYAAKAVTTTVPDSSVSGDASFVEMDSFDYPWQNKGADTWFRMQVLFPSGTNPAFPGKFTPNPMSVGWNMFMEWHNSPGDGPASPYVGVWNNGDGTARLLLKLAGGDLTAPQFKWIKDPSLLEYDRWYEITVRMKWSPDPDVGYVEWWVDGEEKYSANFPTLYGRLDGTASSVLFQTGHYRRTVPHTDTLYFDGVEVGPTRGSIEGNSG